ncbi:MULTISPECIES: hypothetical protein [Pedobacter]|uniref:hypothetical protein n=1 Tax=Pedobacter TaxID=84567 RepID=UPI001E659308|nr:MULTISPECIES: hypothetical protein [Pedobacter]
MKKIKGILVLVVLFSIFSTCKKSNQNIKEAEVQELELLKQDIINDSESVTCENALDWQLVALGTKPCGGPMMYIAYSNKIDQNVFLHKVAEYNAKSKAFNEKWDAFSDCIIIGPPKGIACVNGKPYFIM